MDPNANIARQRELAEEIVRHPATISSTEPTGKYSLLDTATELAELVQALDEWRLKGGFDPYGAATREALINEARDLLCEQIRDPVGEANPEYTRGIVELISRSTGGTADELEALAAEIGLKLPTAEQRKRLEYLRGQIRAECISYGEIAELQDLADHIEPGDVELLEWAGVPEFPEEED